ncbi:MAG: hypothetical protein IT428_00190 [Planctomycetaceae bacterium]|nr:hypothetical protein [Planctomycetaceae bacterium]
MDLWHIAVFAGASLLALRSFVTLTQHHQRLTLRQMLKDHQEKVQAAANSSNVAA